MELQSQLPFRASRTPPPGSALPCRMDGGTTILITPIFFGPDPLLNPAYAENDTIRGLTTVRGVEDVLIGFQTLPGAVSFVETHPP